MSIRYAMRLAATSAAALALLLAGLAPAADFPDYPDDPLESPSWEAMAYQHLGPDANIVFDDRVQVSAPAYAENSLATPVSVTAPELEQVEKIVVIADLNPISKILEYYPVQAAPAIAFRFKIQQATPVRAAMRTADGVWHVGGRWISAQGGGCTAASVAAANPVWLTRLMEVSGEIWPRPEQQMRLRFRVIHPMDTGLAAGIPAFYITDVTVASASGETLARLKPYEPISENPVLTLDLDYRGPLKLSGRDNNGNLFAVSVPGPAQQ